MSLEVKILVAMSKACNTKNATCLPTVSLSTSDFRRGSKSDRRCLVYRFLISTEGGGLQEVGICEILI